MGGRAARSDLIGRIFRRQSTGEIAEKLTRARQIRRIMLLAAEANALAGHIPTAEVEKIKRGTGPIDTAQDDISLAALYRKFGDELNDRSPVTAEMVTEAAELGTELVVKLKPTGAVTEPTTPEQVKRAVAIRDRFWTLLVQRHEELWKAGAVLFGRQIDDHVPPLQSRRVDRSESPPPEDDE